MEKNPCYQPRNFPQCTKSDPGITTYHPDNNTELEDQLEIMSSSLIALTTHYAQMQFRIRQISEAPQSEKECMMKDLDEFANREIKIINDIRGNKTRTSNRVTKELDECISEERKKQKELSIAICDQMKTYQQHMNREEQLVSWRRQIREVKKMKSSESRYKLSTSLRDELNEKDSFIEQLKFQIADLEQLISFMKIKEFLKRPPCNCRYYKIKNKKLTQTQKSSVFDSFNAQVMIFLNKTISYSNTVIQDHYNKYIMKPLAKPPNIKNHWGRLRANLEVSILEMLDVLTPDKFINDEHNFNLEDMPEVILKDVKNIIKRKFARNLRKLMEHGLYLRNSSIWKVFTKGTETPIHVWKFILLFYEKKNGKSHNTAPQLTLSKSLNLNSGEKRLLTIKEELLEEIASVVSSYAPYRRSINAHFRAFVCVALNKGKLSTWLRYIFMCRKLVNQCYQSWSYTQMTGFEDALESLDRLSKFKFNLPVYQSVQSIQEIQFAF